jgi:hypothetical protein
VVRCHGQHRRRRLSAPGPQPYVSVRRRLPTATAVGLGSRVSFCKFYPVGVDFLPSYQSHPVVNPSTLWGVIIRYYSRCAAPVLCATRCTATTTWFIQDARRHATADQRCNRSRQHSQVIEECNIISTFPLLHSSTTAIAMGYSRVERCP